MLSGFPKLGLVRGVNENGKSQLQSAEQVSKIVFTWTKLVGPNPNSFRLVSNYVFFT